MPAASSLNYRCFRLLGLSHVVPGGPHALTSFAGSPGVQPLGWPVLLGEAMLWDRVIAFIRPAWKNPNRLLAGCAFLALFSLYYTRQANKRYYLCCKAGFGATAIMRGCPVLGGTGCCDPGDHKSLATGDSIGVGMGLIVRRRSDVQAGAGYSEPAAAVGVSSSIWVLDPL